MIKMESWDQLSQGQRDDVLKLMEGIACLKCQLVLSNAIFYPCEHRFCEKCADENECSKCNEKIDDVKCDLMVGSYIRQLSEKPEFSVAPFNSYLAGSLTFDTFKNKLEELDEPEFSFNEANINYGDEDWIPTCDKIFRRNETVLSQDSIDGSNYVPETQQTLKRKELSDEEVSDDDENNDEGNSTLSSDDSNLFKKRKTGNVISDYEDFLEHNPDETFEL